MKFLADIMVCNLARWLRIFGFDTAYAEHGKKDSELIEQAQKEGRVFLTKDKKCGSKANVLVLKSASAVEQLKEIQKTFNISFSFPEKTRCAPCNGELEEVAREKAAEKVPPKTKSDKFWLCKSCGKVYWRGAHWKMIEKTIEELKE